MCSRNVHYTYTYTLLKLAHGVIPQHLYFSKNRGGVTAAPGGTIVTTTEFHFLLHIISSKRICNPVDTVFHMSVVFPK